MNLFHQLNFCILIQLRLWIFLVFVFCNWLVRFVSIWLLLTLSNIFILLSQLLEKFSPSYSVFWSLATQWLFINGLPWFWYSVEWHINLSMRLILMKNMPNKKIINIKMVKNILKLNHINMKKHNEMISFIYTFYL